MPHLNPDLLSSRYGTSFAIDDSAMQLGNFALETILAHKSIRSYQPRALDPGSLELLVSAAESASTSSNLHTYSIIAVEDVPRKDALSVVCGNQQHISDAPLFLVFCADLARLHHVCDLVGSKSQGLTYTEMFIMAVIDAALAAQNLVVAAESIGLGTCYIGGARNHPGRVAELLQLPKQVFAVSGLTIGYPLPNKEEVKPRFPQANGILHRETYSTECDAALERYDDIMRRFNNTQPGREGKGWLSTAARRVATAEALGAERPALKKYLEDIGLAVD
jgi:nitroreductase